MLLVLIYINRYSILNIVNLESIPLVSLTHIFTNITYIRATIIISITIADILYLIMTVTNIIFLSIVPVAIAIIIIALNNIFTID